MSASAAAVEAPLVKTTEEPASGAGADAPAMDESQREQLSRLRAKDMYETYRKLEDKLDGLDVDHSDDSKLAVLQVGIFSTIHKVLRQHPGLKNTEELAVAMDAVYDSDTSTVRDPAAAKQVVRAVWEFVQPMYEQILMSIDIVWKRVDQALFVQDIRPRLSHYVAELATKPHRQMFVDLHSIAALARRHEAEPPHKLEESHLEILSMLQEGLSDDDPNVAEKLMNLMQKSGTPLAGILKAVGLGGSGGKGLFRMDRKQLGKTKAERQQNRKRIKESGKKLFEKLLDNMVGNDEEEEDAADPTDSDSDEDDGKKAEAKTADASEDGDDGEDEPEDERKKKKTSDAAAPKRRGGRRRGRGPRK